jgi:hypothetical protein
MTTLDAATLNAAALAPMLRAWAAGLFAGEAAVVISGPSRGVRDVRDGRDDRSEARGESGYLLLSITESGRRGARAEGRNAGV